MYALYLLVAVIVLLNALIAMMSSTYAKVQVSDSYALVLNTP